MRARSLRGALLGAAALVGAACGPVGEAGAPGGPPGRGGVRPGLGPAPEFELRDLSGRPVRLADYRGRALVIDFWATWCAPCVFQVPELNAFHARHRDANDVAVLGIAVDAEGAAVVEPWVREQGVEYPIAIGDEALARRFGAQGFPTVAIVRADGTLDMLHAGLLEQAELEGLLEPLRPAPER